MFEARAIRQITSQGQAKQLINNFYHIHKVFLVKQLKSLETIGSFLGLKSFIDNDQSLFLTNQEYNRCKFKNVCQLCLQINLKCISFNLNNVSMMIQQIRTVYYPNLLSLSLNANNIESIQLLTRIYMPKIKHINLQTNKITCLKQLQKLNHPNLQYIEINQNKWNQLYQHNCNYYIPNMHNFQIFSYFTFNAKVKDVFDHRRYIKIMTLNRQISLV